MTQPADPRAPKSTRWLFVIIVVVFLSGFIAFFTWSVTQRQASQAKASTRRAAAEERDREQAERAGSEQTATGERSLRRPFVTVLPNGDREVLLLDGTVVKQPAARLGDFELFAEGERNTEVKPSGILPNGRWVYENVPYSLDQNGTQVEVLRRITAPEGERPRR